MLADQLTAILTIMTFFTAKSLQQEVLRLPRNCSEVQVALPNATDDHYTLDIDGQPATIYCYFMNTSNPQEYITLHYLNRFDKHFKGNGRTYFQKVAINLQTKEFIKEDWNFSFTEFKPKTNNTWYNGTITNRQPFGDPASCTGSNFVEFGHCDLRDTGFGYDQSVWWKAYGFNNKIEEVTLDLVNNETFHVRCGGFCGGCRAQNLSFRVQPGRAAVSGRRVFLSSSPEMSAMFDNNIDTSVPLAAFSSFNFFPMAGQMTLLMELQGQPEESFNCPIQVGLNSKVTRAAHSETFQMDKCSTSVYAQGTLLRLDASCPSLAYNESITVFVGFPRLGQLNVNEIIFNAVP